MLVSAGITEHHALVAGALFLVFVLFVLSIHPAVDVVRLFVDHGDHPAGVAVETVFGFGVTDAVDHIAGYALQIDVRVGFDFTGHNDLTGSYQRLAGYFGLGIVRQEIVQQRVGDLVGDLVGMPFGNRFRCE